jgi:dipeptidase
MRKLQFHKKCFVLATVFMFLLTIPITVFPCSTLIVGKKASVTGDILFGHNEDDGGRLIMTQTYVPRMTHAPGEMITNLEASCAQIPQVPETLAYYWSEARTPGGASFADVYFNEYGVAIGSDSCASSKENAPVLKNGGVGYGLRRVMAERATSARNAVEVAAALIDEYGYAASGRTYTIADGREAWSLQVVRGKHYVAQKVGDDEVYMIPNHYTIRKVNLSDTENFIASPDLITYAILRGWYTPAVPGDYSDFDFAKAYQAPGSWRTAGNVVRHHNALEMILNQTLDYDMDLPFSVKPNHKLGLEDVKAILRTHYEGTDHDLTHEYTTQPSTPHYTANRVICTSSTVESDIWQLRENPLFSVMWRTAVRPCTGLYVPWYPGTGKIPAGYNWLEPIFAQDTHFNPPVSDYDYNQDRAIWAFLDLQNLIDPMYGQVIDQVQDSRDVVEKGWAADQKGIETAALAQHKKDPQKARDFLAKYNDRVAGQAWDWARKMYNQLVTVKIDIVADEISRANISGTVPVAILSKGTFDATTIDPTSVSMGAGYRNSATWPKSISTELVDINGDGQNDLVAIFNIYDLTRSNQASTPCLTELFLQGVNDGSIFVAEDVVNIVP